MPALPLDEAGRYVAAAYLAFTMLVVIYVVIIAAKVSRVVRALEQLGEPAEDAAMTPASRSAAPGGGARWRG